MSEPTEARDPEHEAPPVPAPAPVPDDGLDPEEPHTPAWFSLLGVGLFLVGGGALIATADPAPPVEDPPVEEVAEPAPPTPPPQPVQPQVAQPRPAGGGG